LGQSHGESVTMQLENIRNKENKRGVYIILYADNILLIAPSVSELQHLLIHCEAELHSLDIIMIC